MSRTAFRFVLGFGLALAASACGGGTTDPPPDTTTNLSIQAGDGQTATVGEAVPTPPAIKVVNGSGSGVAGVAVTFAVASGGGSATGTSQTTNAQGIATVGSWTLGTTAGTNSLTATIPGKSPVNFSATGRAGAVTAAAKSAGDNQTAKARAAVATRPAVSLADQHGNPVVGAAVTFAVTTGGGTVTGAAQTTDAAGVATVGSWVMGPGAGANQLTATIAGSAVAPLVFSATAEEVLVQPSQDTTLGAGTLAVTRLVIPAGRTVTVAGNLVINADSVVEIAGTLAGTCVGITINGERTVTISGSIDNSCASATDPGADLRIVAKDGYSLSGTGDITTSGKGVITDDPDVTGPILPAALRAAPGIPRPALASSGCHVVGKAFVAKPVRAKVGANGKEGEKGADASNSWTLWCEGADLDLGAGVRVFGQDGGHGGVGADLNKPAASAKGGAGGRGGNITVGSTARVVFSGAVEIHSGDGGDGGDARGTGLAGQAGLVASSATATGGVGGEPGLIRVQSATGIVGAANVNLVLGNAGKGGNAEAEGADGESGKTPDTREQNGGPATATGGAGGHTPDKQLTITGAVAGVPVVSGAAGGKGGDATASAGHGADAPTETIKDAGFGGAFTAVGGAGGNSLTRNHLAALVGNGGNGGFALFRKGKGGKGWDDCQAGDFKQGGRGGDGGSASGADGVGGTGLTAGNPGNVFLDQAGNGGNGGNGMPVGGHGNAGANGTTPNGAVNTTAPSFTDGADGNPCAPPPPEPKLLIDLSEVHFVHVVGTTPCPTDGPAMVFKNDGDTPLTIASMVTGTNANLIDVPANANGTLAPGEMRTVILRFNCGQARSVNAVLKVTATVEGGAGPQVVEVPVVVDTKVPALKLAQATGPYAAGQVIPLASITGLKRVAAHPPICDFEHGHENVPGTGIMIQGSGPYFDPASGGCGFGEIVLMTLAP
ncbi:MAG: hypothetical protein AB7S39_01935 [Gemmatimonadales bacterium]